MARPPGIVAPSDSGTRRGFHQGALPRPGGPCFRPAGQDGPLETPLALYGYDRVKAVTPSPTSPKRRRPMTSWLITTLGVEGFGLGAGRMAAAADPRVLELRTPQVDGTT